MSPNIVFVFCVILLVISFCLKRSFINPAAMFFLLWGAVIKLSSLELYGLAHPRSETYGVIFWGLCFFGIGFFLQFFLPAKNRRITFSSHQELEFSWRLNYRVIYFCAFVAILYNLISSISAIKILFSGGSLGVIRSLMQDSNSGFVDKSLIMNFMKMFFARPISNTLPIIAVVEFFQGRKNNKLIILSVLLLMSGLVATGGRSPVVCAFLSILICFTLARWKKKKNIDVKMILKKYQNKILVIVTAVVVVLFFATFSRSGSEFDTMNRQLYYYFSMEPIMLERWMDIVNNKGVVSLGLASLNGIVFAIMWVLHNVLFLPYPEFWYNNVYTLVLDTENLWMKIGSAGIQSNAYVTIFFFPYVDGRLPGVIIGMFIFGIFVARFFKFAVEFSDCRKISLYCLLFFGLFQSFIRFPFSNIYFAISWLYLAFVLYVPCYQRGKLQNY